MSRIELSTNYSSKRALGWCQDASDFKSLKKVVQVFDNNSEFHNIVKDIRLPLLIDDKELVKKYQEVLNTIPLRIKYTDLVGTHATPRSMTKCNAIIQASIEGQGSRGFLTDWASDSFVRWAHLCGFIKYNGDSDNFEITETGLAYSNTEDDSEEEYEILLTAILSYPPVSRILQLLSNGEHLSKFEIGSNLGFLGDNGFTSLPQNVLLTSLAMTSDSTEKNKMKSDWDGSSDKYARQICKWLEKLRLVRQETKNYDVKIGNEVVQESLGQSYMITPNGLKAFRRIRGVNKVSKVSKNVYWEMLCTKGSDRDYLRNRRAYIVKILSDSSGSVSLEKIREKLLEFKFEETYDSIKDDIRGLINIGLFINETNGNYTLNDNINGLVIPINSLGTGKSDTSRLKDFCRGMLDSISHNYLNLIDLAYDPSANRQFEMEVVDLLTTECGFSGLHLGGGRKPDGIIYTENLDDNYGAIIDTKAYKDGYSLPIHQADEMQRYVSENDTRDKNINPNEWWNHFPNNLEKFCFLFVSSKFVGQFEDRLRNIASRTNRNGAAINIVNLLVLAESIKSQMIELDDVFDRLSCNAELNLIGE